MLPGPALAVDLTSWERRSWSWLPPPVRDIFSRPQQQAGGSQIAELVTAQMAQFSFTLSFSCRAVAGYRQSWELFPLPGT